MVKKVTSYKILSLLAFVAVLSLAMVGFWFAEEKSDPVYLSKIDKLMFDKTNKAPKFVLSLPDLQQLKQEQTSLVSAELEWDIPNKKIEKPLEFNTLEDVIAHIPNLSQLKDKTATRQLRHINYIEGLTESENSLILPKISEKGEKSWETYGNSVDVQPNFKKVAIVIKGLGLDALSLEKIVKSFDSEISISLSPYTTNPGTKILQARQFGHETYVDLLLSSKDFLKSDSGPMSMSITISKEEALQRLKKSLSGGAPIGGVVVNDGIADVDNSELLTGLLQELRSRGLLMIDATHGTGLQKIIVPGLARRKADIVIDNDFRRESIAQKLQLAEDIAYNKGRVLLVVDPKPIVIMQIYEWVNSFSPQVAYEEAKNMELTKPFALVPVSNLVTE